MCGIVGFWRREPQDRATLCALTQRMAHTIAYRGPDDAGEWVDVQTGLAFGHRRLSIVDLSPEGHQPMTSASGRYVITYNGEVYNYLTLRRELNADGHSFRGHSDTEVMLTAMDAWGVERALQRFVGMFAFAVWDRQERRLHLVRDRLGIKPLYVYQRDGTLLFASELKSFAQHPAFVPDINREALLRYLRYRSVPAPGTIYTHACKLLPGHLLTITDPRQSLPAALPYWSPDEVAQRGLREPLVGTDAELITQVTALLKDAVGIHMVADVPLGAFLSGGVDSSTVVALMQAQSGRPVKTFSVGFQAEGYNEAVDAAAVAAHLGTDHTEIYVTSDDALAVVPRLADMFDEPFADPSQIPTFLVSQLARQHVTVSLSGDGGDEVFGGYNRYLWVPRVWHWMERLPAPVRQLLVAGIRTFSPETLNDILASLEPLLPPTWRVRLPGDKLHKLAAAGNLSTPDLLYRSVASTYGGPEQLVLESPEVEDHMLALLGCISPRNSVDRMMLGDMMTYLPDDILTKLDRCSMAVSLEARVPLLDHRVVELAWRLPLSAKLRDGQGKWLLRQVLYQYVPRSLIDRPKTGFDVPIDSWLRGPLRVWATELLDPRRLRQEGLLDAGAIQVLFQEHLSGKRNWRDILWTVLMFETWRERWLGKTA